MEAFAPSVESFAVGVERFAPSAEDFAAGMEGFAPTVEGFVAGTEGWAPGVEGFAADMEGCVPSAAGVGAMEGFVPGAEGFVPDTVPGLASDAVFEFVPAISNGAGTLLVVTPFFGPPSPEGSAVVLRLADAVGEAFVLSVLDLGVAA